MESLEQRFWAKVDKRGPDDCWEWTGAKHRQGYGQIGRDRKVTTAHRVSFELHHGYKPRTCRHTCDNPPCVNPAHLLDGTMADNNNDTKVRNRRADQSGENNPFAKLTAEDVLEIRELNANSVLTQVQIGELFGIRQGSVANIIARRTWKNI